MTSGGKPRPLLGKLTSHGGGGRGGSRVQRGNGREGTGRVEWMIMFVLLITVFSTRLDNNRSRDRDSHAADVPKRLGPTNHELSRLQERDFSPTTALPLPPLTSSPLCLSQTLQLFPSSTSLLLLYGSWRSTSPRLPLLLLSLLCVFILAL